MNESEKVSLAISRELEELETITNNLADLAADAARFNGELEASFKRMRSIQKEADLAEKIDDADYLLRRGQYAYLRELEAKCSHAYQLRRDGLHRCLNCGHMKNPEALLTGVK